MFWYMHTWHMLDDTILLVLIDYHNNWYLFGILIDVHVGIWWIHSMDDIC
jgi:hypothetical protein